MSDYSVTNYNPNNINDTLYTYQSNRTVATNPIQQVPKTNYASSVSLETSRLKISEKFFATFSIESFVNALCPTTAP